MAGASVRRDSRVAVGLLILAFAAAGCGLQYLGLDPDAAHVVPPMDRAAAVLILTTPPDTRMPGVEGSILFIRLVDAEARVILDRPFNVPSDHQLIPAGDYDLATYLRGCEGNCGNLSDEVPICAEHVTVGPGDRIDVEVTPRSLEPGTTCSVTVTRKD